MYVWLHPTADSATVMEPLQSIRKELCRKYQCRPKKMSRSARMPFGGFRLINAVCAQHCVVMILPFRPTSRNRPAARKSNRRACLTLQEALGSKVKAMTFATGEAGTTCVPTAMRSTALFGGGNHRGVPSLMVRECVPAMASVAHEAPLRTTYISTANEALALPWIEKLPGQKRIRFVHGQTL
jgi:hypothetical protein